MIATVEWTCRTNFHDKKPLLEKFERLLRRKFERNQISELMANINYRYFEPNSIYNESDYWKFQFTTNNIPELSPVYEDLSDEPCDIQGIVFEQSTYLSR